MSSKQIICLLGALLSAALFAGGLEFDQQRQTVQVPADAETVAAAFRYRNSSDRPIEIQRVKTSCGCLVAEGATGRVPAGGEGRIDLTLSDIKPGETRRTIIVYSDDPSAPRQVLTLIAERALPLLPDTYRVTWQLGAEPDTRTITLTRSEGSGKITKLRAKSTREDIGVRVETVEAGDKYRLHLTPETTANPVYALVRLTVSTDALEFVPINLYARIIR